MTGEMIERLKKQSEFGKPVTDGKGRDEAMLEAAATIEAQTARIDELHAEVREAFETLTSERSEYLKLRLKVMAADHLASEVREVSQRFYKGDATRDEIESALAAYQSTPSPADPFQSRVKPWMTACFGEEISADKAERNHRFLEEALELVQSLGCPVEDARALVEYVYSRDVGDPPQEVGGVMVTLAALCLASDMDMAECGETELARVWTKVEKIRAKQAAKPKGSALPQAWPTGPVRDAAGEAGFTEWFVKNYPGPDTIIHDPHWHAPRVFRAAKFAIGQSEKAAIRRAEGGQG